MKDSFYFPHDYHARHDPKMAALIKIHGALGYGVWWNFVEILHEQGGKFEKFPLMYVGLSQELKLNEADLEALIKSMINDLKLLKEDATHIWSDRVLQNIAEREQKRLQKVESGRVGGILSGKKRSKTKQNEAPLEANEAKESKVKEIKGKERKVLKHPASPALRAALDKIHQEGLNIYALINKIKKQLKWGPEQEFPEQVLLEVCASYDKNKDNVDNGWPWFCAALKDASAKYWADKNISEHEEIKKQGAMSIAQIMAHAK